IAAAVLTGCTACSNGGKSPSDASSGKSSVTSAAQTIYKQDKLSVPDDFYYPEALVCTEDGRVLFIYNDMNFAERAVYYDTKLNMGESFDIERYETETLSNFTMTDAGLRAFSFQEADGAAVLSIKTFSADGKVVSATELSDLGEYIDTNGIYVNSISFHGEDCLMSFFNAAVIADGCGKVKEYTDTTPNSVYTFDRDGSIICSISDYALRIDKLRQPTETELSDNMTGAAMLRPPVMGDERYPVYLILDDGIYGMTADGGKVMLIDFSASNIKASEISAVLPYGEERFIVYSDTLSLLTVRPDDYKEERETVIVGVHDTISTELRDLGTDFARCNDSYQVEFREYASDRDDLWADILTDDSPDVYVPYDHGEVLRYINLGAIADFGELHDKYGGMTEDDFLPNIVSGMKYKGKLYSMGMYFRPDLFMANREVLSREDAKWNYDEFYDFVASHTDMYLAEHNTLDDAESCFAWICGMNYYDWVDYDNAACSFDSPEFIRLLEFCKNANYIGSYGDSYYDNITAEQLAMDGAENMSLLANKNVILADGRYGGMIGSFTDSFAAHSMSADDITLVTLPNNTRSGTFHMQDEYCVLTSGKCQQGGWEFVNYLLSYDVQIEDYDHWIYLTQKDAFEHIWEQRVKELNDTDREVHVNVSGYLFSYKPYLSPEQSDYIKETVLSCDRLGIWDQKISPILYEEFGSFVAGETSAEDCAKHIQNRVSIVLSEQS
ncbi:MAG: extracellular solute-binding protein, partial [Ruminococcus sp.]|nr:extracellular solute-binding protein [Ruminococcus sp.]